MKKLRIDVWSDIACPWCYVGKRRLEAALEQFPHRADVVLRWRSFELDPSAPTITESNLSYAARLARKYGRGVPEAQGMIANMTKVAAADGITMDFEHIRPGNTFDAHRLLHLASGRGLQDAMKERLFRAYLTEGQALGDRDVLARLAAEVGLDEAEARAVLASDRYARAVRAEETEARELGIRGVPFFVVAGRYGVSGAQPADSLLELLTRAWNELPDPPDAELAEGAVCGPLGCET